MEEEEEGGGGVVKGMCGGLIFAVMACVSALNRPCIEARRGFIGGLCNARHRARGVPSLGHDFSLVTGPSINN